jgi:hypothetical protein
MFSLSNNGPSKLALNRQIKTWVNECLASASLADSVEYIWDELPMVSVQEIRCFQPGCVPLEVVLLLTSDDSPTMSVKILKSMAEMSKACIMEALRRDIKQKRIRDRVSELMYDMSSLETTVELDVLSTLLEAATKRKANIEAQEVQTVLNMMLQALEKRGEQDVRLEYSQIGHSGQNKQQHNASGCLCCDPSLAVLDAVQMEEIRAGTSAAEITRQSKKKQPNSNFMGLEEQRAQELAMKKEAVDSGFEGFFNTDMLSL